MIRDKRSKRLGFDVDSNIEPIIYYLNKNKAKTFMSCGHDDPNRVILKDKKSLDNAKVALNKLKLPKSASLRFIHRPKRIDRKYPMWNMVQFKRGYAHVIVKKINAKYPSFKEVK
jgi:hypothetical protein